MLKNECIALYKLHASQDKNAASKFHISAAVR